MPVPAPNPANMARVMPICPNPLITAGFHIFRNPGTSTSIPAVNKTKIIPISLNACAVSRDKSMALSQCIAPTTAPIMMQATILDCLAT
jgi:hypothetical protein